MPRPQDFIGEHYKEIQRISGRLCAKHGIPEEAPDVAHDAVVTLLETEDTDPSHLKTIVNRHVMRVLEHKYGTIPVDDFPCFSDSRPKGDD